MSDRVGYASSCALTFRRASSDREPDQHHSYSGTTPTDYLGVPPVMATWFRAQDAARVAMSARRLRSFPVVPLIVPPTFTFSSDDPFDLPVGRGWSRPLLEECRGFGWSWHCFKEPKLNTVYVVTHGRSISLFPNW